MNECYTRNAGIFVLRKYDCMVGLCAFTFFAANHDDLPVSGCGAATFVGAESHTSLAQSHRASQQRVTFRA